MGAYIISNDRNRFESGLNYFRNKFNNVNVIKNNNWYIAYAKKTNVIIYKNIYEDGKDYIIGIGTCFKYKVIAG